MIQKITYGDITVKVDLLNKNNKHGVEVLAANGSHTYGVVLEITDRVRNHIKDKEYPLSLSETNQIQDIIMNVLHATGDSYDALETAVKIDTVRPVRGLRPRFVATESRIKEITEAMQRYVDANYLIPSEWIEEYNELVTYLKKVKRV